MGVQAQVYRCANNEYINNPRDAEARGCKAITAGNVTVVQGTSVKTPPAPSARVATGDARRADNSGQRARDNESRAILEEELRKAQAKQSDLLKEYNNGEPEKQGNETRNYQKYLDRVAEMKASISRNQSDIESISRELSRVAGTGQPAPMPR